MRYKQRVVEGLFTAVQFNGEYTEEIEEFVGNDLCAMPDDDHVLAVIAHDEVADVYPGWWLVRTEDGELMVLSERGFTYYFEEVSP